MKPRYIIYIVVAIICIAAIIGGVYYQVFIEKPAKPAVINEIIPAEPQSPETDDPETIRKEFNGLFDNTFYDQEYDTSEVERIAGHENDDIVYCDQHISENGAKHSVKANLPQLNIKQEFLEDFRENYFIPVQEIANKIGEVIASSENYIVYNVDYVSYLNDNILSLVIKTSLKEEGKAEKVSIVTCNYDIETGKELSLNDVLEKLGKEKRKVNEEINSLIKKAAEEAKDLAEAYAKQGIKVYQRRPEEAIYITDHVTNFIVGEDGQIYIIYAYGNNTNEYTNEMDIVKVK